MARQGGGDWIGRQEKKIEALLHLQYTEQEKGVSFECSTCPASIQKLRRCREPRDDFTAKDGALWPMAINRKISGPQFPFCPGKATWDAEAVSAYRLLLVVAETGSLYESGGIANQPSWLIDMLSWFLPRYNDLKFFSRARAVLGSGEANAIGR